MERQSNLDSLFRYHSILPFFSTYFFEAFSQLKQCKLQPTIYTYTNLINACVRCFETEKAAEYLAEMKSNGVEPNEVTYTALIKGYCQDGDITVGTRAFVVSKPLCSRACQYAPSHLLKAAIALLDELCARKLEPNIRTYNTLLRGCMRNACAEQASALWLRLQEKLAPDSSSFEYYIKTLCSEQQVDAAWALARAQPRSTITAPAWASLALASALAGDIKGIYIYIYVCVCVCVCVSLSELQ